MPADLTVYLERSGFIKQADTESWMVLEDLPNFELPGVSSMVEVKEVDPDDAPAFARVFMEAFGMPVDFAPLMAQVIEPSLGLAGVHHYLSTYEGEAIGTCSVVCQEGYGILGSAGVLPAHRRRGAATSLATRAIAQAQAHGVNTLMLQTMSGTPLERLLSINGFKRVFTRSCYVLS
jgi:GNAT superfamily N-acetyltransferase